MRFLFITHYDITVWRFKIPLLKRIIELGNVVYVACPTGRVSAKFEDLGIHHIPLKLTRNNRNPFNELQYIFELKNILKSINPDIVQTYTIRPNLYGSWANIIGRCKTPVVNSIMGLGTLYCDALESLKLKHYLMNLVYKVTFRNSKKVIFLNRDDLALFLNHNLIKQEQAALIRGEGVDLSKFFPTENKQMNKLKLGYDPESVLILMVARLIREKGIKEFAEAAAVLSNKFSDKVCFLVIGDFDPGKSILFVK
ncbi:MAG: glycosyltransferase [bacterium]